MTNPVREHRSLWLQQQLPQFATLDQSLTVNVCVVGAGIAGLTTAYLLAREGLSVAVLERAELAGGESGHTTAHLTAAVDPGYHQIQHWNGKESAQTVAASHTAAIAKIEEIATSENIDCDFRRVDGYTVSAPDDPIEVLQRELEAARDAGLAELQLVSRAPADRWRSGAALLFPRQALFHPTKYLVGLAEAIQRHGGHVLTHVHVQKVNKGHSMLVETSLQRSVRADHVVYATHTPVQDLVTMHTKQAPYTTYVIAARIPRAAAPAALLWDTEDPYHYVRVQGGTGAYTSPTHEVLIVGGEDHKTGQADDGERRYRRLEEWTRERFAIEDVVARWCGQVFEPVDGMAFIGRNPGDDDNVYIATGFSGNGYTYGTIAGLLLRDLVLGRDNPWASTYNPARITPSAAGHFAAENLNVIAQYTEHLTGGDVKSVDEVLPGSGGVIREGLKKVALYRDETGLLHKMSAYCPHLGCVVQWNTSEKTWDCPCHGSRFTCKGEMISGPTNSGLKPVEGTLRSEQSKLRSPAEHD